MLLLYLSTNLLVFTVSEEWHGVVFRRFSLLCNLWQIINFLVVGTFYQNLPLWHTPFCRQQKQILHLDVTHLRLFRSEQNKHSDRKFELSPKISTLQIIPVCKVAELFLLQVHGKTAKAHGMNKSFCLPTFPCGLMSLFQDDWQNLQNPMCCIFTTFIGKVKVKWE